MKLLALMRILVSFRKPFNFLLVTLYFHLAAPDETVACGERGYGVFFK